MFNVERWARGDILIKYTQDEDNIYVPVFTGTSMYGVPTVMARPASPALGGWSLPMVCGSWRTRWLLARSWPRNPRTLVVSATPGRKSTPVRYNPPDRQIDVKPRFGLPWRCVPLHGNFRLLIEFACEQFDQDVVYLHLLG